MVIIDATDREIPVTEAETEISQLRAMSPKRHYASIANLYNIIVDAATMSER